MTQSIHVWENLDLSTPEARIDAALEAATWGAFDGSHHKQWVIDQMVRMLTGCPEVPAVNETAVGGPLEIIVLGESPEYLEWRKDFERPEETDEDGEPLYEEWDTGIAP